MNATLMRIFAIALVLTGAILCGAPALATTYTFNVTDGDWHTSSSWSPTGVPTTGDNAIIPSGKTCHVTEEDAYARTIDVDGSLWLEHQGLRLGESTDTDSTSTIDGIVYIDGTKTGTDCEDFIHIDASITARGGWVTLTGSGTVTASQNDIGEAPAGALGCCASIGEEACPIRGRGFIIDEDLTIKGNLTVSACLELNGTAVVDDGDDVMVLGDGSCNSLCVDLCSGPKITGAGTFDVSAGRLEVLHVNLDQATAPAWDISGGTIQVGRSSGGACTCTDAKINITMTGGTIDYKQSITTTNGFQATGGTVIKRANKTVVWR